MVISQHALELNYWIYDCTGKHLSIIIGIVQES